MNNHFREVITWKALAFKIGSLSPDFGPVGENSDEWVNAQEEKGRFKNVCAPLHPFIVERLESTCSLLGLSKREFITQAIISALDETEKLISDLNVFEHSDKESN